MTDYSKIKFNGTFRPYQQRVLDNSVEFLENGKIHIVAAPGSGKTILGLELIRKLEKPALILSPTIAIREQWKERFAEKFVGKESSVDDYFSVSLKEPKLIMSITYQGLYSSYKKTSKIIKDEDLPDEEYENFSTVNIIKLLKENNIGTICLDEAHHLRAEWQKALYEFIKEIENEVKIIALTATPPYDSKKAEWDKYIEVCGEIDDEIFVPELVRSKTLCPHQDYVCYNYPSKEELESIKGYKNKVHDVIGQIFNDGKFLQIITESDFYKYPNENAEKLLDKPLLLKAILSFLNANNLTNNKKLFSLLSRSERSIKFSLKIAETLFQGMMTDVDLFKEKDRDYIKTFLTHHSLLEKKKVCLVSNSRLDKLLISSIGKLQNIKQIVDFESQNLGKKLRLLVLTDYIKDNSAVLGSDKAITEMGVVPIFELIRRNNPNLKLAAVSGKIVIIPNESIEKILIIAQNEKTKVKIVPIKNTQHSEIKFESTKSSQKIAIITKAFNGGIINAIVGTKSLLGEGWDSPVINTLIMASFVGSFVLSNQMRGRAIRIDHTCPDKVSNIWHLTTIVPKYLDYENKIDKFFKKTFGSSNVQSYDPYSADYETLMRRFVTFVGLNYTEDVIENGLDRANFLQPPYDEKCVINANEKTFALAKGRDVLYSRWQTALEKASDEIVIEKEQKQPILHSKFVYFNILALLMLSAFNAILISGLYNTLINLKGIGVFLTVAFVGLMAVAYTILIKKLVIILTPYKVFKNIATAVLITFQELSLISRSAILVATQNKKTFVIDIGVKNCSNYEKNIFFQAMATLLNPIENPRYLLIKKGFYLDCSTSFAVPEIFANNKTNAEAFSKNISKHLMRFQVFYTRSVDGRKLLRRCRNVSFISKNFAQMFGRKKLKQLWE